MKLFRIAKSEHIQDMTGSGARLYGGRWNEKGISVIYTSESLSLAILEYLVHLPLVLTPPDLQYRLFDVPDDAKITNIRISSLPDGWDALPCLDETVRIGSEWTQSGKSLLLRVPSIIVPDEYNFLINTLHPDFHRVKASRPKPFIFDERILERTQ